MDRIKSALELAMEKLNNQEKKDSEGVTFDKTQEYVKAAVILGRSFLQGKTAKEEIGEKLSRYPGHSRDAAVQTFIGELVAKMTLENTPMVLDAVRYLRKDGQTEENCAAAEQLYRQFSHIREKKLDLLTQATAQKQRDQLFHEGIRGSAIAGFNVKDTAIWQQARAEMEEEYSQALQSFRSAISTESTENTDTK